MDQSEAYRGAAFILAVRTYDNELSQLYYV